MKINRWHIIFFILVVFAFAEVDTLKAQCAMCRAVLESEADKSQARGINNGIVYLMVIPYILVGGVLFAIWKSRKKELQQEQ